jgi:hypothetical protein
MSKKYALITTYGELLVPISLLEKVIDQCLMVRTSYDNSLKNKQMTDVCNIDRFEVFSQSDLDAAIVQQKLSSES